MNASSFRAFYDFYEGPDGFEVGLSVYVFSFDNLTILGHFWPCFLRATQGHFGLFCRQIGIMLGWF